MKLRCKWVSAAQLTQNVELIMSAYFLVYLQALLLLNVVKWNRNTSQNIMCSTSATRKPTFDRCFLIFVFFAEQSHLLDGTTWFHSNNRAKKFHLMLSILIKRKKFDVNSFLKRDYEKLPNGKPYSFLARINKLRKSLLQQDDLLLGWNSILYPCQICLFQ